MSGPFESYLSVLREEAGLLSRLTDIAQNKTSAVKKDDLAGLDQCIRQEQALSLSLRGCEQKRDAAVTALGLTGTRLRDLPDLCPEDLQREAAAVCEQLQTQYQFYRSASEVARSTLECNLHQIEKYLAAGEAGTGYGEKPPVQPPEAMKTDYHA